MAIFFLDDSTSSWWQGSAVSRKNSAVNPPTRCLKIRNVPTDSHSAEDIRKALLSKCKGLPILHLAVNQDGAEGVVYVMADRIATAGVIHSLLHGKWFVGQLLSVKFLREERYEQRFPASAQCTLPIEAWIWTEIIYLLQFPAVEPWRIYKIYSLLK